MFKKIDFKKQIGISLVFFVTTVALFALSVFVLMRNPFDWNVLLNYAIAGAILAVYVFVILRNKFTFAFLLFIGGYVFAFGSLIYTATQEYTGFQELAGIIGWMLIMFLVIGFGIAIELLLKIRHKNKALKLTSAQLMKLEEEKALAKEQALLKKENELKEQEALLNAQKAKEELLKDEVIHNNDIK